MADLGSIIGIVLMVIGAFLITAGMLLCYSTKGEYYNQDEVQAMVAAEVLEDERRKRAEAAEAMEHIREEELNVDNYYELAIAGKKKKCPGPLVAS